MEVILRPFALEDMEAVVQMSLAAWAPVFASFEQVLGTGIYRKIYPDWRAIQRETVESICRDTTKYTTWVADVGGAIAGFVTYEFDVTPQTGEVQLLAVNPDFQQQGIATKLNQLALEKLKEGGMTLAVVGTGGDPGHAPARRAYEKVGYTALPIVRYYKEL